MGEKKSTEEKVKWERELRVGALASFRHFRRLLASERPLSDDDRKGLIDMLNFTEEHMLAMWEIEDMVV